MPGRILDRLLPLVPIVVPPAAEQPYEKNIVSTLHFPEYRNVGQGGGAFRLEIRDKRERCTSFAFVKKRRHDRKFYLRIFPTGIPTDRLNFHESFARRGSRYIVYRNIHIRIGLN